MNILLWTKQQIKIGHNVNFDSWFLNCFEICFASASPWSIFSFHIVWFLQSNKFFLFLSVVIIFYCMTPIKIYPHFNTFFSVRNEVFDNNLCVFSWFPLLLLWMYCSQRFEGDIKRFFVVFSTTFYC